MNIIEKICTFIHLHFDYSPAFISRILNFDKLLYWSNVYEKVQFCRVLKIKVWQPKAVHCLVIRIDYLGYINMQSVWNTVYVFTGHFSKFFLFTLSKFVKIVWIIFAKYHKALFLRYFLFGQIKKVESLIRRCLFVWRWKDPLQIVCRE